MRKKKDLNIEVKNDKNIKTINLKDLKFDRIENDKGYYLKLQDVKFILNSFAQSEFLILEKDLNKLNLYSSPDGLKFLLNREINNKIIAKLPKHSTYKNSITSNVGGSPIELYNITEFFINYVDSQIAKKEKMQSETELNKQKSKTINEKWYPKNEVDYFCSELLAVLFDILNRLEKFKENKELNYILQELKNACETFKRKEKIANS